MKDRKALIFLILSLGISFVIPNIVYPEQQKDKPSIRTLTEQYQNGKDNDKRAEILKQLQKMEPTTPEDAEQLRKIIAQKEWDEDLFVTAAELVKKINKPDLAYGLIGILEDEKEMLVNVSKGDKGGKSQRELQGRFGISWLIIQQLGKLKNPNAIPVLKECLQFKGLQYSASEALREIGDKTSSEQMRELAYKGGDVNYGGLGFEEAKKVIADLQDKSKEKQWSQIAKQIVLINDPKIKPYLPPLFTHEKYYVCHESASKFTSMVTQEDIPIINEMLKNTEFGVRHSAIDAIKRLNDKSFGKVLEELLLHDPYSCVRSNAANALGYVKIENSIPPLEKALNDKDLYVRQQTFISLYILTGKKYDFEGKDAVIERIAERQKIIQAPAKRKL